MEKEESTGTQKLSSSFKGKKGKRQGHWRKVEMKIR